MFTRDGNRFYLGDSDNPRAEITFETVDENRWSVSHTFVEGSLRGQGMAEQLLDAVADLARREGKKLEATCSYALKQLRTNAKYRDVVA